MSSSEHDRDDKAHDTSPNIVSTRAINGHVFHSLHFHVYRKALPGELLDKGYDVGIPSFKFLSHLEP